MVYAKRPFVSPAQVLDYLGRYTHRVAISNERLVSCEQGIARFRWKDYAHGEKVKLMDLEAEEFIRRFVLHVVPDGFARIRHFGLLLNGHRVAKLARCRHLLAPAPPPARPRPESLEVLMLRLTGVDIRRCPVCHRGRLRVTEILPPVRVPAHPVPVADTSRCAAPGRPPRAAPPIPLGI